MFFDNSAENRRKMKCSMMIKLFGRCKGGSSHIGKHSGKMLPSQSACPVWNYCKGNVRIGSIIYGKFHKNSRICRKQQKILIKINSERK